MYVAAYLPGVKYGQEFAALTPKREQVRQAAVAAKKLKCVATSSDFSKVFI